VKLFNQLKWFFLKEWKRYLGAITLLLIIAILQLLPPKLLGILVDAIIQNKKNSINIFNWVISMLATSIIIYIFRYIWRILLFGASYKLAVELRKKLYESLSKHNMSFYLTKRTGDLMARATNDVDRVVFAAGEGVLTLVDSLVIGFSVLVVMSTQISLKLTIIALLPMPIMAFIIQKFGKKLHIRFLESQAAFSSLNNQVQESLTSIRMIKAFGLEKNQLIKFNKIADFTSFKNMEVAKVDACFEPIIHFFISMSNILSITVGGWLVWTNVITLGQLTSFIMYLGLIIWPMLALAWMFNIVERGSAAWERIQEILIVPKLISDKNLNTAFPKIINNFIININCFKYPKTKNYFLKNIKIILSSGKILGLCGPTGSGKTTVLNLIQRHFPINKGEIIFNGVNLNQLSLKEWRNRIAVVNQTTFLFSDTIFNNIALGKPNATYSEIKFVAILANIHTDIIRFPKKYNTQVGEKGVMLSGGQKQRIAIARALLLNTELLILDDALSAVDGCTEHKILRNIKKWKKKNQSIIISSHRLSVIKNSDKIIVMKNGNIIQHGSHINLMKEVNWYSKMYNYQHI